jgi:hypothetical protein
MKGHFLLPHKDSRIHLVYPLINQSNQQGVLVPNPCILWIACPELKLKISRLESEGKIEQIHNKLIQDIASAQRLIEQHSRYVDLRWNLLTEEHKDYIKRKGWKSVFTDTGIGGIHRWKSVHSSGVKCLHTHYAHYLYNGDNVVGEMMENEWSLCA